MYAILLASLLALSLFSVNFLGLIPWDVVITVVGPVVIGGIVTIVLNFLKIDQHSRLRGDLNTALTNALKFAVSRVTDKPETIVDNDGLVNSTMQVAKDYLNENASSLLAHLKIGDNALAMALEARLLDAVNSVVYTRGQISFGARDPAHTSSPTAAAPVTTT